MLNKKQRFSMTAFGKIPMEISKDIQRECIAPGITETAKYGKEFFIQHSTSG